MKRPVRIVSKGKRQRHEPEGSPPLRPKKASSVTDARQNSRSYRINEVYATLLRLWRIACSSRFKASAAPEGGAATLPEGDTMYLIVLVALAMALIIFATAKLNLHPFLTLSATACGFGALFGHAAARGRFAQPACASEPRQVP